MDIFGGHYSANCTVSPRKSLCGPAPPLHSSCCSLSGCPPKLSQDAQSSLLSTVLTCCVHSVQGECPNIQTLPLPWPLLPVGEGPNSELSTQALHLPPAPTALAPADPSPPLHLTHFAPVIQNHFRFSLDPQVFDPSRPLPLWFQLTGPSTHLDSSPPGSLP